MARLEAFIDFGDDEQIFQVDQAVCEELQKLVTELQLHLKDHRRGEIARDGARVCILGRPNAGKSSLFNLLLQKKASIVSSIPGTTRDIIQRSTNIGGYAVQLFDTAGIHHSSQCPIETEGISIGLEEAQRADFLIFVISLEEKCHSSLKSFLAWLALYLPNAAEEERDIIKKKSLFLLSKPDLLADAGLKSKIESEWRNHFGSNVFLCTLTQDAGNINTLLAALQALLKDRIGMDIHSPHDCPVFFRERHRPHLVELERCVSNTLQLLKDPASCDFVIACELLRQGCTQIGYVTGKISSEDILDALFKNFCIGK